MSERFRTPYVPRSTGLSPYQRGSLGELIARRGDIEAEGARQSGGSWANAIAQLGNIAAGAVQEYGDTKRQKAELQAKEMAERPAREMMAEKNRLEIDKLRRESAAMAEGDLKKSRTAEAFAGAMQSPSRIKAFEMVAADPEATKMLQESYDRRDKARNTAFGEIAATVRRFEDSDAAVSLAIEDLTEQGYDAQMVAQVAEALKDPARRGLIVDSFLKSSPDEGHRALVRGEAKGPETSVVGRSLVDKATGKVLYRDPSEAREDNEPLVPVIGDDGQPVLMRRSQAEGRKPASNREQGRPVTAGDAARIAELDTSLDDLAALEGVLGTTGAGSQIGAMLPNVVTEITGIGEDSKQRQAMIDRVKQVIGKALEGGVLRKEDEVKYEKILPRIGDDPQVAATKIKNLKAAIAQRRQRELETREDAGYDVSKFRERQGSTPNAPANAPKLVKYQGKMVPFSSLSPELQALVLKNAQ